jgi:single-strand DNA-binding protein
MAHTITGRLNKTATHFQAGESVGFGLRLGVKFYDRESKSDQWTNYEAVVFAKAPNQINYYQQVLVEGAIVELSREKQKIKQFQGANGLSLSIELLDAKLGVVYSPAASAAPIQPQQPPQPQQAPQQTYGQPAYGQQYQQQNTGNGYRR